MSELTEADITAMCQRVGRACTTIAGHQLRGSPLEVHHIALNYASATLTQLSAMTLCMAEGVKVDTKDERHIELIRSWGAALALYPDQEAIGEAMTAARNRFLDRLKD